MEKEMDKVKKLLQDIYDLTEQIAKCNNEISTNKELMDRSVINTKEYELFFMATQLGGQTSTKEVKKELAGLLDKAFDKLVSKNKTIDITLSERYRQRHNTRGEIKKVGFGCRGFKWNSYGWYGDKLKYMINDYTDADDKIDQYNEILQNSYKINRKIFKKEKKTLIKIAKKYLAQIIDFDTRIDDVTVTFPEREVRTIKEEWQGELSMITKQFDAITFKVSDNGITADLTHNNFTSGGMTGIQFRMNGDSYQPSRAKMFALMSILEIPEVSKALTKLYNKTKSRQKELLNLCATMYKEMQPYMLIDAI